jgi:hypothetical protein
VVLCVMTLCSLLGGCSRITFIKSLSLGIGKCSVLADVMSAIVEVGVPTWNALSAFIADLIM